MIDEATGQELEVVQPTLDEVQAEQDALAMAEAPAEEVQLDTSAEEASIVGDVARFIGKAVGVTPDVPLKSATPSPKVEGTTAAPKAEAPKAAPTKKEISGLSAWKHKEILAKKPLPPKPKVIGEMVVSKPRQEVSVEIVDAPEVQAGKLFDKVEQGVAPKFAVFNPEKEAANLVESDIDQFNDSVSHQINFNTLENEDDVNAIIASMAESNKANIDFERRGVVGDDQLQLLAKDIGADPKFLEDVMKREAGGAVPPAEYIVAMRQVLNSSATKLKILADKINLPTTSAQDKIDFTHQFDFHRKFQSKFMGVRAEYGRGLRAMGVNVGNESDALMVLGAMEKNIDLDKLARMISNGESAQGINKLVDAHANNFKYSADMLYSTYMSSMLSGLSTQVLNVAGSISNMSINMMERKLAALIPKGKGALDDVQNDEVTAMMIGYTNSFMDAWKAGWKTLKTGEPYKGFGVFGEEFVNTMPSEQFDMGNITGTAADLATKALLFPLKNMMGSGDAFFKVLNERAQLSSLSYRTAKDMVNRGEITPSEFPSTLANLMENPQQVMMAQAESYSKEMAYQETPGKVLTKITSALSGTPGMRWVVPFVKTIGNITRQTLLERTPIGMLSGKIRDDIAAGGSRRQLALAKMGLGTGITAATFMLAENGKITGPMPKDDNEKKAWKAAGIKPFSVVFDNADGTKTYTPYTGLEPFATFFGIAASLADYGRKSQYVDLYDGEDEKHHELVSGLLFAISENTMNKTFAVGMQNFFDATSGNNVGAWERMINGYANTLIPYAGLRRNITKEMDEIKRATGGTLEYIQSQIPGMSDKLPPVRDIFGEEVKHDYTWVRWSPTTSTNDPVNMEILRLREVTHQMAVPNAKDNLGKQRITPEDREKWMTYARRDHIGSDGRTLKERISDTIQEDSYLNLLEVDKVKRIQSIVKTNDMAAMKAMSKDDPELARRLNMKDIVRSAMKLKEFEGMDADAALEQANEEFDATFGGF